MASTLTTLAANATSKASGAAGSAAPAWRQFPFFDVVPVKDVHDLDSSPDIFKATPEISTMVSSSSGVLVADIHGSIHLLNRDFEPVSSWIAHIGGRVTHMVERRDILITLGEEDSIRSPLLKIWDMQNFDNKTGAPVLLRSTKIQLSNRPHPVTTVALSATLSHLAIGLGDGTVILYRHLDQSLSSSTSLTSLPKIRTIHESPTEPITGLGFREPTEEVPNLYLFVVTTNRVLCYQASGKGSGGTPSVVDEIGTGLGCASIDWRGKDIVVARDEAIYVCNTEGRGNCWAYEGSKSSIHTHLNYLVIVSPPFIPSASAASATVRHYVARSANPSETDITKVTVFDPENKIVAYSGPFREGVREVISQWGNIYILTSDGQLLCLQEKSTADKLDMLYRKTYFPLALNVAKTQNLDESSVADIHRQYGDHLYSKGDYDGAMQQFVQTIGHLQPSYVIRKFLDAQRIHNLVTYLQELHSLGLANSDHTTLLLNTYTKLKDVARLDSFIKTESKRNTDAASGELPFDLDTAIRVCRQAGYFEHAAYLAKKYERHEDYLRIQIEDAGDFRDAGAYLRKLGPEAAESNLARYGRAMLHSLPEETTQLLIDLCTTTGSLVESEESTSAVTKQPSSATSTSGPSYLSYLALHRGQPTTSIASDATPPSPSIKTVRPENVSTSGTTTPPRPTTSSISTATATATATATGAQTVAIPQPQAVRLPSPRVYFAHFVDHMEQFVVFLETVAYRRYGQSVDEGSIAEHVSTQRAKGSPASPEGESDPQDKEDQVAIWNTLLELYLTLPGSVQGGDQQGKGKELKEKAMKVLRSHSLPYDPTHALILCSTHGFTDGLVLLWERLGMYEDIIRFWIERSTAGDASASKKVVEGLKTYGENHLGLFPLVLRFLTSTHELLAKHREDLREILDQVEEGGIMPPLGVVQLLSRNGVASVGLVKEWLMMRIKESREEIEKDKNLIRSYRLETAEKLKQVEELTDTQHPKVFHVTRCAICKAQLDLPAVHFMCSHSYHQRCIQEHDTECPNCAREHGVIREIRRNNERLVDQHDIFLAEVQEKGFEAVATAFSRGILNMGRTEELVRYVTQPPIGLYILRREMGFKDRVSFHRKSRRCRHFKDSGSPTPIRCPLPARDCFFIHPEDPQWRDAKLYMGNYTRRSSSSEHRGGRERERDYSPERSRDSGWSTWERQRERQREREWSSGRSRSRERALARFSSARERREDSVASSREDTGNDTAARTVPSTPVIPSAPAMSRGKAPLPSPTSKSSVVDFLQRPREIGKQPSQIKVGATPRPPSLPPSPLLPPPSTTPLQSPVLSNFRATTTPQARIPTTPTSATSNSGFLVPDLPPPSSAASSSSFAVPAPPSTKTTNTSSSAVSVPPSTASPVAITQTEPRPPASVKPSTIIALEPSTSKSSVSSVATTMDISSSSSPAQPNTPTLNALVSMPTSTIPFTTHVITPTDATTANQLPNMNTSTTSDMIPGLTPTDATSTPRVPSSTPRDAQPPQPRPQSQPQQPLPPPRGLSPPPSPPPLPPLPSFEPARAITPELTHEAKLELWAKRTKTMAEILIQEDQITKLTSDIHDLTRYSTSPFFTSDPDEKKRIEANIEDLKAKREAAKQAMQKGLDMLIGTDTWPSVPVMEEVQKRNEKVQEYVVGLADVMKEVGETLKELAEIARKGGSKDKGKGKGKKKDKGKGKKKDKGKGKEKMSDEDAMEVDSEASPAIGIETETGAAEEHPALDPDVDDDDEDEEAENLARSEELNELRTRFESLSEMWQNISISLDQAESSWMGGVKEMFQDLVEEQRDTIRTRVEQHKSRIEEHVTQLKSDISRVDEKVTAASKNVDSVVDETAQALEKILKLREERDALLADQKKFLSEELPVYKAKFAAYDAQREKDQKRCTVLEAALNAYVNRPPSPLAAGVGSSPSTPLGNASNAASSSTTPSNNNRKARPTPHAPEYLLNTLRPYLTQLLRENVKPLIEEFRQRVEEMMNAQKEEMYGNVWRKIELTCQVLGKVQKSAEIDIDAILGSADVSMGEVAGRDGSVDTGPSAIPGASPGQGRITPTAPAASPSGGNVAGPSGGAAVGSSPNA